MKSGRVFLSATVLILSPFAWAPARASLIAWDYSWTPSPQVIEAANHGTGGIAFTRELWKHMTTANAVPKVVVATSSIVFSAAFDRAPDHLFNAAYHLILKLKDDASRATGTLTFKGLLNGTFSWDNTHITNKFISPTTQAVHLGFYWYWVTIGPFIAPTSSHPGEVKATITVKHNPEPSTWLLAGLGTVSLMLIAWRRRRGRSAVPPLAA
jgi:hypothetical protein